MKWYNDTTHIFMSRGYLNQGQGVLEKIKSIGDHAENILGIEGFSDKLQNYIKKGYYIIPTPVWKNFNADSKESAISCFGVYISDSVKSILKKASEVGMQNKIGGGSSGYFGDIRPRGAKIGFGGQSNGTVSMMEIYQSISNIISQPSRRGHFSASLDIEHDDFDEFIRLRTEGHPIQDLSFSVCIGDDFMNKVLSGDEWAVERFRKVVKARYDTGFPYIFFKDTVNKNTVDVYKDKNLKIHHSNMCQPESATILKKFDDGSSRIVTLKDISVGDTIWSGKKWTKVTRKWSTGVKDVYKYNTSTGYFLGTDNHRIVSNGIKIEVDKANSIDWSIGDSKELTKNFDNSVIMDGLVFGDGGVHKASNDLVILYIGDKDTDYFKSEIKNLILKDRTKLSKNAFEVKTSIVPSELSYTYDRVIPKRFFHGDEVTKRSFLRGLFSANGSVVGGRITLTQSSKVLIEQVREMLSSLGIHSYITKTKGRNRIHSNGEYFSKDSYNLNITSGRDVFKEYIGFIQEYKTEKIQKSNKNRYFTSKIQDKEYVSTEEVFEITVEDEEHTYWTGGVLVSNCTEIALPNNEDETFVCNLLGMNIELFDEWKDTDAVETGIYFMDAMLTDFINKNENEELMLPAVNFAKKHRAMGMGASGYHDYLQSKMIPFESFEAKQINARIFKTIKEQAYAASEKMAKEYGKPEYLKEDKYKRRHTTLLCVAPNTSSAFIMGQQSQSIEPLISNYYIKDVAKMRIDVKNKHLKKLLAEKGQDLDHVWSDILAHKGSVQHLPFLSDDEKKVFKTFSEISPIEVLTQAAQRQAFIDQSQSLNLMIPENLPIDYTAYYIIKAWKLGIKTLYYQLNVSAAQELNLQGLVRCVSCEG